MFLVEYPTVFIFRNLFGSLECRHVTDFNTRNKLLSAKLLNQGHRYHTLRKAFSKFYRRHFDLVSTFNTGLKSLLQQGLSEPDFMVILALNFVHAFLDI